MITAKDIKNRGVKAIEDGMINDDHLSISVRGRVKYVVLKADDYKALRLAEKEMSYLEIAKDIEKGQFIQETSTQHMDRLWKKSRTKCNPT